MSSDKSADTYKDFLDDISQFSSEKEEKTAAPPEEAEGIEKPASVGQRVRKVREEKGLTLEDIAQRTGLDPEYLDRIETEQVSPPLGTLIRLAKSLDMKLGRFISTGEVKPFT
jgi:ribosome-binding protein aMBF1 (putative translation factor)